MLILVSYIIVTDLKSNKVLVCKRDVGTAALCIL